MCNLLKLAKGTVKEPGTNVKQKSGFNRSILDQFWFKFRRQLDCKSQWQGRLMRSVPSHKMSYYCLWCGHVIKENWQTPASFQWIECGYNGHADMLVHGIECHGGVL
ncbi:zinc ribbon domain-containing protein [Bartonella quintana]|uniref:zinc ribbon domain-containing protein n=1 Tax=Bartonella quintana TaxID=803 RepID=UPI0018D83AC2|nr:zinc ribbon domain-containing protein [Bartonella quintana]